MGSTKTMYEKHKHKNPSNTDLKSQSIWMGIRWESDHKPIKNQSETTPKPIYIIGEIDGL